MISHNNHSLRVTLAAFACVLLSAATSDAATYFLSPDGDDDNRGSETSPWRSVERANEAVEPGDTVVFLPGDYQGTIAPHQSGRDGAPITYRSRQPHAARLTAASGRAIDVQQREHILIEDFEVDGQDEHRWLRIRESSHITIENCRMHSAGDHFIVFEVRHSQHISLIDNILTKDHPRGDMVHLTDTEYVLVEGNSFARVGHGPFRIGTSRNVVVRANVLRNDWGRNYEFWSTGRILVEGNVFSQNRDSAGSGSGKSKNLYHDGIFRFNRVYDNRYSPMVSGSYIPGSASPTHELYREPFRLVNSRIYHNTFADNVGLAWDIGGMNISSNTFQNNIFHRNDWTGGNIQFSRYVVVGTMRPTADNRLINNLFRGSEPGQKVIRYEDEYWTVEQANENTPARGQDYWTEYSGNIDADPAFTNPQQFDYRLTSASEAIDAGKPLAYALREGDSNVLEVTDGVPFFDGFGIEGEQGDWIMIGEGDNRQLAQIERIELRYYMADLLHLDREVSWTSGMPVSLPWSGEAPDLGAYDHQPTDPRALAIFPRPATAEPGEPVSFELTTAGNTPRNVQWRFDDGYHTDETEPAHAFDAPGDYGVRVRATLDDGTEAVAATLVKVREPAQHDTPLVAVDFQPDTWRDTWGYHFKFYRGWQTGHEHVEREDGTGKKMHLFYDDTMRNDGAGALAPGEWEIEAYPYVQLAYRIQPGTPVALRVDPFDTPDQPEGFILGGTSDRDAGSLIDLDAYELIADGQWHKLTIDLRRIREHHPEVEYLHRFLFHTQWDEDQNQAFWFDDFTILPATAK